MQLLFCGVLLRGFVYILAQFLFSFSSMRFVSFHVVRQYSDTDTASVWKKSCFILLDRSEFCMINTLLIAIYTYTRGILTSLLVAEILLCGMWTCLLILGASVEKVPSHLKRILCFVCIYVEANASCSLLKAMQLGFCLGWCICKKRYIICIVRVCYSFCRISSSCRLFFFFFSLKPFFY